MGISLEDRFTHALPSGQVAVDTMKGLWVSAFPTADIVSGGNVPLFSDPRVSDAIKLFGGSLKGKRVLELGPLEGGHTYMAHKAGAEEIVAIEGNSLCYLKTLVTKEVYRLDNVRVLHGEIERWLATDHSKFDLVLASGVLYHFTDPLEALIRLAGRSKSVFIWTHYMDDAAMPVGDPRRDPFTGKTSVKEVGEHRSTYHYRSYMGAETTETYCGGMENWSIWVEKDDITRTLMEMGFEVEEYSTMPDHPNGPCSCFFASK
jgi:SAM-dependent methyltransferase